jgi:nucleoid-associated protein YgaU
VQARPPQKRMSNPFNDPKKSPAGQDGPTPWGKIGIAVALVAAVALLAVVVVKAREKLSNPEPSLVEDATNLPALGTGSNAVPELPPEVTAALANSPTNLPDDVSPTPPPGAVPANTPVVVPPVAAVPPAPVRVAPVAAVPPAARARVASSHYAPATVVTVRRGDTLWHIARTHGTTVAALKAANGLKSDRILVGQKLKVPRHLLKTVKHAKKLVRRHHRRR